MMRRSRISVRPNVRPGGRASATSQDGPALRGAAGGSQASMGPVRAAGEEAMEPVSTATAQMREEPTEAAGRLSNTEDTEPENVSNGLNEKGQNGGAPGGSESPGSAPQRRKRFSATPNLAKPRVTPTSARAAARTPKSPPPKATTPPPAETLAPPPEDSSTSQGLRSTRWRRASGGAKAPKTQGKQGPLSPAGLVSGAPPQGKKEKETPPPLPGSQPSDTEKPPQEDIQSVGTSSLPDAAPLSVTVSQGVAPSVKTASSLPPAAPSIVSDRERIAKARKLRELLRQELRKQRKRKKGKSHICEHSIPQDHNKMTMRDLIYYLPESNPMKPYPVEETRQTEKVIPQSPSRELPEKSQERGVEVEEEDGEEEETNEPSQDDQLVVPRVKVAEDGTLILDEESLTVEVLRTKGPNVAEETDPIFERGSSTTYSSFRKAVYTKPWSNKETEMFFLAISMVGTDFSMIGQLFPHRARTEIKNKFKKEERENSWRIDKAFKEKQRFDLDTFSKLLDRILAEEEMRRKKSKIKSSAETKMLKKSSKQKGKMGSRKRAAKDWVAEEEPESDTVEVDSETVEKENEDCSNVAELGDNAAAAKSNRKRRSREEEDTLCKTPDERGTQKGKPAHAGETILIEECEDADSECPPAAEQIDRLKRPGGSVQERAGPVIKPAQLSRGRLQRPTPNLGARWAKKTPQPAEKAGEGTGRKEGTDNSESQGGTAADTPEGRTLEGGGRSTNSSASAEEQEEEEPGLTTTQESKLSTPTSSRRTPRLCHLPKQARQEESGTESTPAAPSHCGKAASRGRGAQPCGRGRRGRPRPNLAAGQRSGRPGKPKLVTLRAAPSDDNEEEEQEDTQPEEDFRYPINPEEQNQAPAFVPLSVRSPQPVPMEVVETMEELEISVVGSAEPEHAPCPQPECQGAPEEGLVPAEHQLDLLVDVIEFLSPEHVEGSEESYNEAARTLLTIRNPELLSLAAPGYSTEVVISEESPHEASLEEEEEEEESRPTPTSKQVEQPQRSMGSTQAVTSDLSVTLGSVAQSEPDVEGERFTADVESETGTEPSVKPRSCDTAGPEGSVVSTEPHQQEGPAAAASAGGPSRAVGPKSSVQSVPQGRRSRFPKPKPNLVRTARAPRTPPGQHTGTSAAIAAVEPESLNTIEVERRESDRVAAGRDADKQETEGSGEETQRQDEELSVGDCQEGTSQSESSAPSIVRGGRRQLTKPRPILDRALHNPRLPLTQNAAAPITVDERVGAPGDSEGQRPREEELSSCTISNRKADLGDEGQGRASAEESRTGAQAQMKTMVEIQMEETDMTCSTMTVEESGPADREKTQETPASFDSAQEVNSIHIEDDLSTAISSQTTEGVSVTADFQPSTFFLTLFEVSPPPISDFQSVADPMGVVTAELISPLVFVEEQPSLSTQSETQSYDPLNMAAAELGAGCGQVSHLVNCDPLVPVPVEPGEVSGYSSLRVREASSTDVTKHSVENVEDLHEDKSISLSLVVEESCASDVEVKRSSKRAAPPCKRRRMPDRSKGGNQQVKPNTSEEEPAESTEGDPRVLRNEHPPRSPGQTPPPHCPAAQCNHTEPTAAPQTCAAEEVPRGTVGYSVHPQLDRDSAGQTESTESSTSGEEPQSSHQTLPQTSDGPLTRTGRKPKGFLSFISNKSTPGPAGAPRTFRPASQRPQVNTSRIERRRPAPVALGIPSTDPSSVSAPPSKVRATASQGASAPQLAPSQDSRSPQSEAPCVKASKTDQEPTNVSEYFFSDIFTQVEELD
ncbi:transcription factor TFIIIB component B'' homolog isoform X2 [Megalops cyprinoides]|uniref:transcription factor TFIIIB component B'' homolog isoform X2 n=1 Tax=Megalops cyprinoides TaxID=118141 RepID=UPI001863AB0E|nr:transcription factor TFIIIB component B'' homolog isoform X2 [Megalops cyprinoides]